MAKWGRRRICKGTEAGEVATPAFLFFVVDGAFLSQWAFSVSKAQRRKWSCLLQIGAAKCRQVLVAYSALLLQSRCPFHLSLWLGSQELLVNAATCILEQSSLARVLICPWRGSGLEKQSIAWNVISPCPLRLRCILSFFWFPHRRTGFPEIKLAITITNNK